MGFPRQEYWSRLPFPSPGDLPDPGIKLVSRQILYRGVTWETFSDLSQCNFQVSVNQHNLTEVGEVC